MNFFPKEKSKIAVGLSGGVDSAVSALKLKEAGHEVTGVYLQCWEYSGPGCSGDPNRADAASVSSQLGINFTLLDFIEPYKEEVIDYFYKSYEAGLTPNPDILCNTIIKFGLFLDWALQEGYDYIATGHYAQRMVENGLSKLYAGVDEHKDQSYFLYRLNQFQLSHAVFPLGESKKSDVRILAKSKGLSVYNKPDSTGICFIGDVNIKDFLKKRFQPREGLVLDTQGEVIGKHEGVWFYTIGQRHGFEISKYVGIPMYVVGKNVEKNELVVGPIKQVFKTDFLVTDIFWTGVGLKEPFDTPKLPLSCKVRIRNLGEFYECTLSKNMHVSSKSEIFGVAPGQSAVFYREDSQGLEVLGGGVIN